MTAYIIRRLWQMIPTMLGVILLVFFLFNWVGGDPAYVLAGKISQPGADRQHPAPARASTSRTTSSSGSSSSRCVTGNFGASWSTNEQVSHILATRLGPSLTVAGAAADPRHADRDRAGARRRLRARLADRPAW